MTKIVWDQTGERTYETGVDRGVLYLNDGSPGVPWNGLVSINENSSGGEIEHLYFDGIKYLVLGASEDFQITLEAFDSPSEFNVCDGTKSLAPGLFATQQPRKTFGLTYRTRLANDVARESLGYKIHIVYNASVAPSSRSAQTLSGPSSPRTRQWSISTVPVPSYSYKPTAHLVVDSTKIDPYVLGDLESFLYGRTNVMARFPSQSKVIELLGNHIIEPLTEPI